MLDIYLYTYIRQLWKMRVELHILHRLSSWRMKSNMRERRNVYTMQHARRIKKMCETYIYKIFADQYTIYRSEVWVMLISASRETATYIYIARL